MTNLRRLFGKHAHVEKLVLEVMPVDGLKEWNWTVKRIRELDTIASGTADTRQEGMSAAANAAQVSGNQVNWSDIGPDTDLKE